MWFRNLQLYRLGADRQPESPEELEARLARRPLTPCGGLERQRIGWVAPREDERLVYALDGQLLLAMGIEDKLLPAAVVRQAAEEKLKELEAARGYPPGRKSRREVREQVEDELLPKAFSKRSTIRVWIDPRHRWLGVDTASSGKAEAVLGLLADCVPDLEIHAVRSRLSPGVAMTGWLADGEAPAGFSIDRDCELRLPVEERATVRYLRHALDGDEIRQHISGGKRVTRLALTWAERISFVLDEEMQLKRLAFLDVLKERSSGADDAESAFQTEFALMSGELARLLGDLMEALDGEEEG